MQILTECLSRWDNKTRTSKGKGILGTVKAFTAADEELGHKTLHQNWQIWIKEMSQTLRNSLFNRNNKRKLEARKKICKPINNLYVQVMEIKYASLTYMLMKIICI